MKTLNAYIAKNLILTILITIGVLTFVMLSGHLFRLFDLISRGASPVLLGRMLLYLVPDTLRFSIPMAVLCATVLCFSRMSSDNEITAMKASGISLWQIISPALILCLMLSAFCFWLTTTLSPHLRYKAEMLKRNEGVRNPLVLLEPGSFSSDLPGYSIRIGKRNGRELYDIHIYAFDKKNRLTQDITAQRGRVGVNEEKRIIELALFNVTFANVNLDGNTDSKETRVRRVATQEFLFPIRYGTKIDRKPLTRKLKYLDLPMLFARIYVDSEAGKNTTPHYLEMNMRMSMALSPLAFLLIGIPFGIRSRRSETSVGLLLSVILAVVFYSFILLSDSLESKSRFHPELLVWLPNILYQVGGLWALAIIGRH